MCRCCCCINAGVWPPTPFAVHICHRSLIDLLPSSVIGCNAAANPQVESQTQSLWFDFDMSRCCGFIVGFRFAVDLLQWFVVQLVQMEQVEFELNFSADKLGLRVILSPISTPFTDANSSSSSSPSHLPSLPQCFTPGYKLTCSTHPSHHKFSPPIWHIRLISRTQRYRFVSFVLLIDFLVFSFRLITLAFYFNVVC